jgi:hypothetical protein
MKILSLSTIAALSLSLAACGGKKDEAGGGTGPPTAGTSSGPPSRWATRSPAS